MSNNKTYHELTHPQKRIWHTELVNSGLEMSNIGYLITLNGIYDKDLLKRAIIQIIKNNDGLRLRFRYEDETKTSLEQYISNEIDENIEFLDVATRKELETKINQLHSVKFDVIESQLCYFNIFKIGETQIGFYEKAHHLIADGISAKIVANEIIEMYDLLAQNSLDVLNKKNSYYDFILNEKKYLSSDKYAGSRDYWKKRFDGYCNSISLNSQKITKPNLRVLKKHYPLPNRVIKVIAKFNNENNYNGLFVLLMSALNLYFNRFYYQDDVVIGMPVHNRSSRILRDLVGMFVSTLPFRLKIDEQWEYFDLLKNVKKLLWEDLKHQSYPYNILVNDLNKKSINTHDLLNIQLIELPNVNNTKIDKIKFYSSGYNQSEVSIYINQKDGNDLKSVEIVVEYRQDLFEEKEIDRFYGQLMFTVESALTYPSMKITDLDLVTFEEKSRLLFKFNDTKCDYPKEKTIHQLFEDQAGKNSKNIALECDGKKVTYEELNLKANNIALMLIHKGVKANTIVGLFSERDENVVAVILGILKAGGVYLPIDPQYPEKRIDFIINDSNLNYLLVQKDLCIGKEDLFNSKNHLEVIDIEGISEVKYQDAKKNTKTQNCTSQDLAYVIYTSGTTGNPKGVLVDHRGVVNYLTWADKQYIRGDKVKLPLYTSLSFDLTITSLFLPLTTGNTIVVYKEDDSKLMIQKVIEENRVNIIKLTPAHLKVIADFDLSKSVIKRMILGGEELETSLAENIYSRFDGDIEIFNEYGPTETVVGCMIHKFNSKINIQRSAPIGKAGDNVRIYILDDNQKLLPEGVVGELCIAGDGISRGYLNRPILTNTKFVTVLIDSKKMIFEKVYCSGDRARWNIDGNLEYFGRIDEQVKIKGYRIELGEIEKQILLNFQDVIEVVVTDREDESGQKYLCGYIVENQGLGTRVKGTEIKSLLNKILPDYMIPSFFVNIDKIPLTLNGKVDKKALPPPEIISITDYIEPRNDMEKVLVGIWKDILDLEKVSITDNFFELGGDSIKAVQIAAKLNNIDLSLNVKEILTHHTIEQICLNVDLNRNVRFYEQNIVEGTKGLTPIESWFFEQKFDNPNYYNQSVLLDLKKDIDISMLETTFKYVVKHHDGLRLNYQKEDKIFIINNNHLNSDFNVHVIDLSDLAEEEKNIKLIEVGVDLKGSFDINKDLLLKALIVKYSKNSQKLLITAHHLVVDGISWRIILEDLFNIYSSLSKREKVVLPKKTASVIDWYDELLKFPNSKDFESEMTYWNKILEHEFTLQLDITDKTTSRQSVSKEAIILDKINTEYLVKEAHKNYNTNVETLLIVSIAKALNNWTGYNSFVIEMENHGRQLENIDVSRTVGWFTAMYPLKISLDKEDTANIIKSIKEQIKSVPNNGLGYGIQQYLLSEVDHNKKSQVRFNYLGQFDRELNNELFSYSNMDCGSEFSKNNDLTSYLEINCLIIEGKLKLEINFDQVNFLRETIISFKEDIFNELINLLVFLKNDDEIHFTPSDFDAADLDEEDLEVLFGS